MPWARRSPCSPFVTETTPRCSDCEVCRFVAARWEVIPSEQHTPPTDVMRTGTRLVLAGEAAIPRAYPDLPGPARTCPTSSGGNAPSSPCPCVPGGRTVGAVHLSFAGAVPPDQTELDLHRARRQPGARADGLQGRAAGRARLRRLVRIDVVRDGRMHRLAVAHVDPRKVELAVALQERWPPDPQSPNGAYAVARSGKPELLVRITDEMLVAGCRDPEQLRIARELELRSALSVPLLVRGRVTGVLTWVSTDEHRLHGQDDVRFAEHLARRAATAIDIAELYSQTRAAAEQLQRAVLPEVVAGNDTWESPAWCQGCSTSSRPCATTATTTTWPPWPSAGGASRSGRRWWPPPRSGGRREPRRQAAGPATRPPGTPGRRSRCAPRAAPPRRRLVAGGRATRHRQGGRHDHAGMVAHRRRHLGGQRLDDQQAAARLSHQVIGVRVGVGVLVGGRSAGVDADADVVDPQHGQLGAPRQGHPDGPPGVPDRVADGFGHDQLGVGDLLVAARQAVAFQVLAQLAAQVAHLLCAIEVPVHVAQCALGPGGKRRGEQGKHGIGRPPRPGAESRAVRSP